MSPEVILSCASGASLAMSVNLCHPTDNNLRTYIRLITPSVAQAGMATAGEKPPPVLGQWCPNRDSTSSPDSSAAGSGQPAAKSIAVQKGPSRPNRA